MADSQKGKASHNLNSRVLFQVSRELKLNSIPCKQGISWGFVSVSFLSPPPHNPKLRSEFKVAFRIEGRRRKQWIEARSIPVKSSGAM